MIQICINVLQYSTQYNHKETCLEMNDVPINGLSVCKVMFKPVCSICGKVIDNLKIYKFSDMVDANNIPVSNIEPKECPYCKSHIKSIQTNIQDHLVVLPPSNGLTM